MGGDNIYTSCKSFAKDIFTKTKGITHNSIIKNGKYVYSAAQQKDLKELSEFANAPIIDFNLIDEIDSESMYEIYEHMKKGEAAIEKAGLFTQMRFKDCMENFDFPLN
jgi:hypothetical protein